MARNRLTIFGHHRSRELAERHARELSKEHGKPFEIIARRDSSGRYSKHGHSFEFQAEEREWIMWLLTVDFKVGKRHYVRDVLVPGFSDETFADLHARALETIDEKGRDLLKFMNKNNTTIAEGPPTRARKAQFR